MSLLMSPYALRDLRLRNRVVVAPMLTYRAEAGHVGDWHLMHLGQFAAGGAGLVMMESTKVEARGCSTLRDAGLWSDGFVAPLARIVGLLRSLGAAAGIQLGHSGRKAGSTLPWEGRGPLDLAGQAAPDGRPWDLIGPSALPHAEGRAPPRAMERADIDAVVTAFAAAARRADEAGFDALELHAAHGYLVHQFLSPAANARTDGYGGGRHRRMRFGLEVAEAVRAVWPSGKPLFVRVSAVDGAGWDLADSVAFASALAARGVDVVDCSSGGIAAGSVLAGAPQYGYQVPYAARIRREAGVATMAVGLILHADQAEAILAEGSADLVAIGREFLHNPHWTLDAAQKLERVPASGMVPPSYGYWLDQRAASGFRGQPSTWRPGEPV